MTASVIYEPSCRNLIIATAWLVCKRAEILAYSGARPTEYCFLRLLLESLPLLGIPGTTRYIPINANVPWRQTESGSFPLANRGCAMQLLARPKIAQRPCCSRLTSTVATAGSDDTAEVMLPTPLVTSLCTAHKSSYRPVQPALSVMVKPSSARSQLSRLSLLKVQV